MTELSLHILDVANNSTRANAKNVEIDVIASEKDDSLIITIVDDGDGMSEELLNRVTDPFATTRSTRRVGLGVPLFQQSAIQTGGEFKIESKRGEGTKVTAKYVLSSIDRMPLGDLPGTMATLIGGAEQTEFTLRYIVNEREYEFSTVPIREMMDGVPLSEPEVNGYIQSMISENIEKINGGILL